MRVAVTGGTGFLGAHIVEQLTQQGHEAVCLVRPTSHRDHLDALGVTQVPGSLSDEKSLRRLVADADALVHVAGVVAANRPSEYLEANTTGTKRLLDAFGDRAPERLTYVSSLAAKGPSPNGKPRPAGDPPAPVSTYGESKLGGEHAVREYAETTGTPATIIRPPALYGPRDRRILGLFKTASRGLYAHFLPPGTRLSLLYGPDCADIVVKSLTHPTGPGPRVLLWEPADASHYSSEELCAGLCEALDLKRLREIRIPGTVLVAAASLSGLLGRLTGPARMLNPDKVRELRARDWLSDTRTLEGVDWRPRHTLAAGLSATHDWFQKEGWL